MYLLDLFILMGTIPFLGPFEGVQALKMETFLGPEMSMSKEVPFGPK
jgi:hypothetical protein